MKADWSFPRHKVVKASRLHELFTKYHVEKLKAKHKVTSSASEVLSLYALVRHFVETQLATCEALERERASFQAACRVLDLILEAKRGPTSDLPRIVPLLRTAFVDFLQKHIAAYGIRYIKPKTHLTGHIADQLLLDLMVLDMFVVERLNLRLKNVAE